MTDILIQVYEEPDSASFRLPIYLRFIESFSGKIDQLKLVRLGISSANECANQTEALSFLLALSQKVDKPNSRDAYVYATIEAARVKLLLGDIEGAKTSISAAGVILDAFDSVESMIHAAFYRVNADYHKAKAEYAAYYRNALLYLACVNVHDLKKSEAQERAYDLSISALLGETIYNFGELLLHPILDELTGTDHGWLRDFLKALNSGNIGQFDALLPHVAKQPLLQQSVSFLRQKICLMSLIEAVFGRPSHDRILTFQQIAQETRLPIYEVEHLVMKALSIGLVKGTIDQVDAVIRIQWVQPRVLDMKQIESMGERLKEWTTEVHNLESFMGKNGAEVFVQ